MDPKNHILKKKYGVKIFLANWNFLATKLRNNLIHYWLWFFYPIFLFQFSKVLTEKAYPEKFWKNLNIGRYKNFRVKIDPVPISVTLNPDTYGPPLTSVILFRIKPNLVRLSRGSTTRCACQFAYHTVCLSDVRAKTARPVFLWFYCISNITLSLWVLRNFRKSSFWPRNRKVEWK